MNSISSTHESISTGLNRGVSEWNSSEELGLGAVEIVILWNDTVQDVIHHKLGGEDPWSFKIGESPDCDFLVPSELLETGTSLSLVETRDGVLNVSAPPQSVFEVSLADGGYQPVDSKAVRGLGSNGKACIELGPWRFVVRAQTGLERFSAPPEVDWQTGYFFGISAALHMVFFLIIGLVPPSAAGLNLDPSNSNNRFTKYFLEASEAKLMPPPEMEEKLASNSGQQKGKRHKDIEGKAGRRDAKKTGNRFGIKGPRDNPRPVMGRLPTKDMARTAGILAYLDAANAPTSPFGSLNPFGRDPENALGSLVGNKIGNDFGFGGLGMHGTGRGGGGPGEGTIGMGVLETIGVGRGPGGNAPKYGTPRNKLKTRRTKGPIIVSKPASVKGSISRDVIRRIVKRHLNEVKFCYEKGLRRRADISGRIAVQFLIGKSGAVQRSTVAGSTIEDPMVGSCIARVIERIAFPMPADGGIVVVTYPFLLSSQGGL